MDLDVSVWVFIGTVAVGYGGWLWKRMARCLVRTDYYPRSIAPDDGPKTITVVYSWGERPLRDLHVFIDADEFHIVMQPVIGVLPAGDSLNLGLPAPSRSARSHAVHRTAVPWVWVRRGDRTGFPRLLLVGRHPTIEALAPCGRTVEYTPQLPLLVQRNL